MSKKALQRIKPSSRFAGLQKLNRNRRYVNCTQRSRSLREFLSHWKATFVFIFILFAVRASFADHYLVPSGSMRPTIHIGDRLLVNKLAYDLRVPLSQVSLMKMADPVAGEIVVFTSPEDGETILVKRLVAVPGDRIEIKNGFVKINGELLLKGQSLQQWPDLGEQYLEELNDHQYTVNRIRKGMRPEQISLVVPDGHYFMMGDNRDNSWDSRGWGLVPRKNLLGKAHRVLFSANILDWPPAVDLQRTLKKL